MTSTLFTLAVAAIIVLEIVWLLSIAWLSSFHPELLEKREYVGPGGILRVDQRRRIMLLAPFYVLRYRNPTDHDHDR